MTKRRLIIGAVIVGAPVLALGWWLGSPLFLDTEVSEAFPASTGTTVPDVTTNEDGEAGTKATVETPDTTTTEGTLSSTPVALVSGQFKDFDSVHQGSGTATVYELEDGTYVLRLEDFEVTNGPDLAVLLVPAANPQGDSDVAGFLDLGSLKGNIGEQNYEIPAGTDLSGYRSVVIYCRPFHVIFSVASLG